MMFNPIPRPPDAFWGEIAPSEHLVQFYDVEDAFLDTLEGFIAGAVRSGDGAIVIATPSHLQSLEARLIAGGVDLAGARATDQLICLDAAATLAQFMVNGWPDDQKFFDVVRGLLTRAGKDGRKVRAFGEMVALLWAEGRQAATVRLEHLWHKLCADEGLALLCAYPKIGTTERASKSMQEICAAHSRVVAH